MRFVVVVVIAASAKSASAMSLAVRATSAAIVFVNLPAVRCVATGRLHACQRVDWGRPLVAGAPFFAATLKPPATGE